MDPADPAPGPAADAKAAAMHARRAASFGAVATAYARHRPGYPDAALAWAAEPLAGPDRPCTVLDLGAGTGKLTLQLAGLRTGGPAGTVIAVEPDLQMLAELTRQLDGQSRPSGRRAPAVRAVAGRAEAIALADGSVDAVFAGQAAHWFDLDRALPEIARVLAPGGVLCFLWNAEDDRVAWVAGLHRASGRVNVAALSSFAATEDTAIAAWLNGAGAGSFAPVETAVFAHAQPRTADSLIDTMRTHSMFRVMDPPERETVLARVRDYLAATPETSGGEFSMPLCTIAMRAVRH